MQLPKLSTRLQTLLKVGALTFVGTFVGVICASGTPTTLEGWKAIVAPALGTALAAELVFLRGLVATELSSTTVLESTLETATTKVAEKTST